MDEENNVGRRGCRVHQTSAGKTLFVVHTESLGGNRGYRARKDSAGRAITKPVPMNRDALWAAVTDALGLAPGAAIDAIPEDEPEEATL